MKKTLLVVLALVLVAALSVGITMAFLQDETGVVTNTFTVGNVEITLDEAKVTEYGVKDGETRVTENDYKLIPNQSYVKDPTIHVATGSELCWIFVKVENGIEAIEPEEGSIADQMTANGWTVVSGETDVYAYSTAVTAGDYKVFETFAVAGEADFTKIAENATVKVTGYAVQAAGFGTAQLAWDATFGE